MSLDQAWAAAAALGNTGTTGRVEISLNQFAVTFMCDCAGRCKPATIDNHRCDLRRLILPTFGNIAVDMLGKADVTIWLDQLDISGRTKDCPTSVLSAMMRHVETLGLRQPGSNARQQNRSEIPLLTTPVQRRLVGLGMAPSHAQNASLIGRYAVFAKLRAEPFTGPVGRQSREALPLKNRRPKKAHLSRVGWTVF